MNEVWILEEFCGSLEDCHSTSFVGAYSTRDAAMKAKAEHDRYLADTGNHLCIDGHCLTRLDIQDSGEIQECYSTEQV